MFYKELSQKDPDNVDYLEAVAEMQVCRGQEKDALRMYENILKLDADNLAANIFLGNYYYLMAEQEKKKLESDYKSFLHRPKAICTLSGRVVEIVCYRI